MTIEAASGDVLAVLNRGGTWFGKAILFFERLQGKPDIANHVIILTHQDQLGRWMAIEGRPRGVGLVDATDYLADSRTRSNHNQPRDPAQLTTFLASCAASLGIGYDWVGIGEDLLNTVHLHNLATEIDPLYRWSATGLPGHVVCSSLAALLYERVGWAHPDMGTERLCEPADWWVYSDKSMWGA